MKVSTIGLDRAKKVFQVHGISDDGTVVIRRRLRRAEVVAFFAGLAPCLVGMEACASAHYWARELAALGHEVRLMPPRCVKAYVKRGKNDAADAEAVRRPSMRFVPVKTAEPQGALVMHKTRDLLVRQRTMLVNALRGHLAKFGVVVAQGIGTVNALVAIVRDEADGRLPATARAARLAVVAEIDALHRQIKALDVEIMGWHRAHATSQRLATIPRIGPITASLIAATVPDATVFRSGRHSAAWLGLTPRQNGTGGKQRLGGISKQGDRSIRRLRVVGATALLRHTRTRAAGGGRGGGRPNSHRPPRVVITALANTMARVAWAVLARGETYRAGTPGAAI